MADTETDTGRGQPPVGPSQVSPRQTEHQQEDAPPPPKKKRTRTLTTPHQSAVLHALLAQVSCCFWQWSPFIVISLIRATLSKSRFPTTAMREEVGRSIGLSARKVQVRRRPLTRLRSPLTSSCIRFGFRQVALSITFLLIILITAARTVAESTPESPSSAQSKYSNASRTTSSIRRLLFSTPDNGSERLSVRGGALSFRLFLLRPVRQPTSPPRFRTGATATGP